MPCNEDDRSDCQPSTTTTALSLRLHANRVCLGLTIWPITLNTGHNFYDIKLPRLISRRRLSIWIFVRFIYLLTNLLILTGILLRVLNVFQTLYPDKFVFERDLLSFRSLSRIGLISDRIKVTCNYEYLIILVSLKFSSDTGCCLGAFIPTTVNYFNRTNILIAKLAAWRSGFTFKLSSLAERFYPRI